MSQLERDWKKRLLLPKVESLFSVLLPFRFPLPLPIPMPNRLYFVPTVLAHSVPRVPTSFSTHSFSLALRFETPWVVCPSVCSTVSLSVCLPACLTVSVSLYFYLPVSLYLSVSLSVCPFVVVALVIFSIFYSRQGSATLLTRAQIARHIRTRNRLRTT